MYILKSIEPSKLLTKKYTANFFDPKTLKSKKVQFGAKGYRDFTTISDSAEAKKARDAYRSRHKKDKLSDPYSPGALSWYILWGNHTNITDNISDYKKHFGV